MKHLQAALFVVLLIAAAVIVWVEHQSQEKLRAEISALTDQNTQLNAGVENLSNQVVQANSSSAMGKGQFSELLKLRGEVGQLRNQTNQMGKLRAENQRLQTALNTPAAQPAAVVTPDQERQAAIVQLNDAKQVVLALTMFADDNQNQYPTNFAQASRYMKGDYMDQLQTNFDLVYQGSTASITNWSDTIVLRSKQAWQTADGMWRKAYGFADGHAQIHSEPDGNFDTWETQRILQPPPNQ